MNDPLYGRNHPLLLIWRTDVTASLQIDSAQQSWSERYHRENLPLGHRRARAVARRVTWADPVAAQRDDRNRLLTKRPSAPSSHSFSSSSNLSMSGTCAPQKLRITQKTGFAEQKSSHGR